MIDQSLGVRMKLSRDFIVYSTTGGSYETFLWQVCYLSPYFYISSGEKAPFGVSPAAIRVYILDAGVGIFQIFYVNVPTKLCL